MQLISLQAVNKCVKSVPDFKTLNNSQQSELCLAGSFRNGNFQEETGGWELFLSK